MKVGTRLTVVLLLCVTPVLGTYLYLTIKASTLIYVKDLKRETRGTTRALQAALELDIAGGDWPAAERLLGRIEREGVETAVFDVDGRQKIAAPEFPLDSPPDPAALRMVFLGQPLEFIYSGSRGSWFCRAVRLTARSHQPLGIVLVAQHWSDAKADVNRRVITSVAAGLVVMAIIAVLIPVVSRRYVSRPLAELSRRVRRFAVDEPERVPAAGDEVTLLTEEFRRLDQELRDARKRLLDESERKLELERQLQHSDKLAAIGTLASGLAHEIGTPLNVIRGRAEYLARNKSNPPKTAAGLEIIVSQIDRISRIVRMLLDFGSHRERPRLRADLRSIVGRTLTLMETEAARRHVAFEADLGACALEVIGDTEQLEQVFLNLVVNALDAMAAGGGALRVSAQCVEFHRRKLARLTFEDTGPGIADQDRARIFDPFFTTKDPGKGTGMGLAVSQSIVRDHDGEITVENSARGARMVVTLPLAEHESNAGKTATA